MYGKKWLGLMMLLSTSSCGTLSQSDSFCGVYEKVVQARRETHRSKHPWRLRDAF